MGLKMLSFTNSRFSAICNDCGELSVERCKFALLDDRYVAEH